MKTRSVQRTPSDCRGEDASEQEQEEVVMRPALPDGAQAARGQLAERERRKPQCRCKARTPLGRALAEHGEPDRHRADLGRR